MRQNTLDTIYTLLAAAKSPQKDIQTEIKQLFPLLAQLDPDHYHKHYEQLVTLAQQIEYVSGRGKLQQKTVIGVGGGFSAGKSRFLNSLLSVDMLPEALEPCTAVATYLSWDTKERTQALNLFNHHVEVKAEYLGQLRHFVDDGASQSESIQLGQLLQHVHIGSPVVRWQYVAFLDTPGYSKADGQHHAWSDYQTALTQLSEADHVIWLVSAKNGTIRNEDLEFLQAIELKKPLFVVITQSDLVLQKEIKPIMQGIKKHLDSKSIPLAGMMAWAAPISEISGKYIAGDNIVTWLDKVNQPMVHDYQEQLATFMKIAIQSGIKQSTNKSTSLEDIIFSKKIDQNAKHPHIQALVDSAALLMQKTFIDWRQASEYHALAIEGFYSQSSLDWLYAASCANHIEAQKQLKSLTDKLKRSELQYYYALFEAEKKNYKIACEYMQMAAKQLSQASSWLIKNENISIEAKYKLANMLETGGYTGLSKDITQAVFKYKSLVESGHNSALQDLQRLVNNKNYDATYTMANLSEHFFKDINKAVDFHVLAITNFASSSSLEWLYQKACSGLIYAQEALKSISDKLQRPDIQYHYALFAKDESKNKIACDYMYLSAMQNDKQAYTWLKNYASKGDTYAQLQMIGLFDAKKIASEDEAVVFDYCYAAIKNTNNQIVFKQVNSWASERKNTMAQNLLATCYAFGYGIDVDLNKAYQIYNTLKESSIENAVCNRVILDYLNFNDRKYEAISFIKANQNSPNFKKLLTLSLVQFFIEPKLLDYHQKTVCFSCNHKNIISFLILVGIVFNLAISNIVLIIINMTFILSYFLKIKSEQVIEKTLSTQIKKIKKLNSYKDVETRKAKKKEIEIEQAKGVWIDHNTNLMWARISLGQGWEKGMKVGDAQKFEWASAQNECQNFKLAGYTDWRMPTINELKTLMTKDKAGYNCHSKILLKPQSGEFGQYWSSSPTISQCRLYVCFDRQTSYDYGLYAQLYVRLVRNAF